MINKQLLYQGKKICYRVLGSGKPVLLIHGFGEDSTVWRKQVGTLPEISHKQRPPHPPQGGFQTPIPVVDRTSSKINVIENALLNENFKFILPDLPGCGESEMIDDMSMEGMAEVMKEIVDIEAPLNPPQGGTLDSDTNKGMNIFDDSKNPPAGGRGAFPCGGFRGACIIGHSMGGYITLAFAVKYPDQLSGFGLFHSSAFADNEEKKATRRKGIDFIHQHGAFEFLKTAIPNLFSPSSKDEKSVLIDEQLRAAHNFSPQALVSYYEAMIKRPDRTSVLEKTPVPVLFIMGKYDAAVPMEDSLKQCHLPEKSYIHLLQNSGHMGMLEEPDESNRALNNFLLEI